METVIKVSSKQKDKEKEEAEPPPKTPDASPPPQKPHKTGWGWRTEDSPPPPAMPPPAKAQSTATKPKDKGKHKVKEVNVESEVDRLIDSQDNVYVLSRPKCGPAVNPTCLARTRADVSKGSCCSLGCLAKAQYIFDCSRPSAHSAHITPHTTGTARWGLS